MTDIGMIVQILQTVAIIAASAAMCVGVYGRRLVGPPGLSSKGDPGDKGYTPRKGVDYFDGEPGRRGDPFRFEDFTPEQLESLRGPAGENGVVPVASSREGKWEMVRMVKNPDTGEVTYLPTDHFVIHGSDDYLQVLNTPGHSLRGPNGEIEDGVQLP